MQTRDNWSSTFALVGIAWKLPGRSIGLYLALLSIFTASVQCLAEEPMQGTMVPNAGHTYRIVPRPLPEHIGKHLPYSTTNQPSAPAQLESRATGPYAYGWFGTKPSPEWSRHFGFSRRYTQCL